MAHPATPSALSYAKKCACMLANQGFIPAGRKVFLIAGHYSLGFCFTHPKNPLLKITVLQHPRGIARSFRPSARSAVKV